MRSFRLLLALLLALPSVAFGQLAGPLMKFNGTKLRPAPFWNFSGAGVTCSYDALNSADTCSILGAGSGAGDLQDAYNAGVAATGGNITLGTPGPLTVKNSAATSTLLSIPDAGAWTAKSTNSANTTSAFTFDTVNAYGNGYVYDFETGGKSVIRIFANGALTNLEWWDSSANAFAGALMSNNAGPTLSVQTFTKVAPLTDNAVAFGDTTHRWTSGFFSTAVNTPLLQSAAAAALTVTANAASTWSTSAGALSLDSAAALNLGITNATSIVEGRSGILTTVQGALAENQIAQVSDTAYTVDQSGTNTDFTVEYITHTASRTVTLPNPAAGNAGRILVIKNNTADTTGLVISSAANSIDGATSVTTTTARGFFVVQSDGTRWMIISRF